MAGGVRQYIIVLFLVAYIPLEDLFLVVNQHQLHCLHLVVMCLKRILSPPLDVPRLQSVDVLLLLYSNLELQPFKTYYHSLPSCLCILNLIYSIR